jgi:hypothetical protein
MEYEKWRIYADFSKTVKSLISAEWAAVAG